MDTSKKYKEQLKLGVLEVLMKHIRAGYPDIGIDKQRFAALRPIERLERICPTPAPQREAVQLVSTPETTGNASESELLSAMKRTEKKLDRVLRGRNDAGEHLQDRR